MNKPYYVHAQWDEEVKVWVASSEDVPGLATESDTTESLIQKLKTLIPELLEANGQTPSKPITFDQSKGSALFVFKTIDADPPDLGDNSRLPLFFGGRQPRSWQISSHSNQLRQQRRHVVTDDAPQSIVVDAKITMN